MTQILVDDHDIQCISCSMMVHPENINSTVGVAKCSHCDSVFHIADEHEIENELPKPQPSGILHRLLQSQQFIHLFLLTFMVFWNISFLIFLVTCINKGYTILAATLGLLTGVGLYLTYHLVAAFFGSSSISNARMHIGNWSNVMPLFGGQRDVVNNLYLRGVYSKSYQLVNQPNQVSTAFKVTGVERNGHKVDLINGLRQEDQAIEIEREIGKLIRPSNRQC